MPINKGNCFGLFSNQCFRKKPITVKKLVEVSNAGSAAVKSLVEKEIFEEYYLQHDRVAFNGEKTEKELQLSKAQENAFLGIKNSF